METKSIDEITEVDIIDSPSKKFKVINGKWIRTDITGLNALHRITSISAIFFTDSKLTADKNRKIDIYLPGIEPPLTLSYSEEQTDHFVSDMKFIERYLF